MIAAELAAALGADLGVDERQRPDRRDGADRAGLRRADPGRAALRRRARRDRGAARRATDARSADVEPIDPMALPGVESVERQGAPPRVGTGGTAPAIGAHRRPGHARRPCSPRPGAGGAEPLRIPKADNYTLRLVAGRRLYDAGSSVTGRPRSRRSCPRWWRGPIPTTSTAWARRPATGSRCARPAASSILAAEADDGVPRGRASPSTSTCPAARARRQRGGHAHRQPPAGDRRATGVGVIAASPRPRRPHRC